MTTPTIPPAAQAQGYSGGGMWSTPAYDPATKYIYWGAGNPNSKTKQYPTTDAILKIDVDPSRATFGQIVASYEGNVDQYTTALQQLSQSPACEASANPSVPDPLDDPVCGQLDLDFGASANLFTTGNGTKVVGDLQKSGVYHVANAATMAPVWTALVGASCQPCNAASTAFDGSSIEGVATPGGTMFSLDHNTGATNWLTPLGDGVHYQSTSAADGSSGPSMAPPTSTASTPRTAAARASAVERRRRRAGHQRHQRGHRDRRAPAVRGRRRRRLRVGAGIRDRLPDRVTPR